MTDIDINYQKFVEKYEREHNIICPFCKKKQSQETIYEIVSYWGDTEDEELICESCEEHFIVKEIVDRTFKTRKLGEEKLDEEYTESEENGDEK